MEKQNDHRGSEANEAWATFRMVFFGWEFCVEVQRKQMVSGGCLGEKTLLDALDGNIYNGDKGENMDFKKN